jgi:hypothetical protein
MPCHFSKVSKEFFTLAINDLGPSKNNPAWNRVNFTKLVANLSGKINL